MAVEKEDQTKKLPYMPRVLMPRIIGSGNQTTPKDEDPDNRLISAKRIRATLQVLSHRELAEGAIYGVPITEIKRIIGDFQQEEDRDKALEPIKKEHHKRKVQDLKALLNTERAYRGEVRGTNADQTFIRGIIDKMPEVERIENILVEAAKKKQEKEGRDQYKGRILPLLRVAHDALPATVRSQLSDRGTMTDDDVIQERLARVLEKKRRISDAVTEIRELRQRGKVMGHGAVIGDQAVLATDGIKIFQGGTSRSQKRGAESPDLTITWGEINAGTYSIGVAPSSFDGLRSAWKAIIGKADSLPATVVFTEGGTGRQFKVRAPDGHRFAERLKTHAAALATADETDAELLNIITHGGERVRALLRTLDNS